jgi:hypothetical protein
MSKVSVQSQSGIIQDASKVLAKKPVAWLLLGNAASVDFAKKIRAESPSTLILLRAQPDNWALDRTWTQDFITRSLRFAQPFQQARAIDFLLPPNEPVVSNVPEAQSLNSLMVEAAQDYAANGYKTGAYTFSVGNPPYPLWQYLQDGINASDGWLFLHEYGAPTLQSGAADLSLRHRNVRGYLPLVPNLKIGITECGIDLGIIGKGGGYRALPDDGHLVEDYLSQLTWWDSELAKDDYVKFATLFGYAMEHPWETFDVAAVDTDRSAFISWLQSGTPIGVPPMSTPLERKNAAWHSIDVPYNPDAAYFKIAQQLALGRPVAPEYSYTGVDGVAYSGQGYDKAFLESPKSDVLSAKAYDWLSGELYTPTAPPNPIPPVTIKRLATADLPPEFGIKVISYAPKPGEKFFGLVGASPLLSGPSVGTQSTMLAVNEQGSPVIGYILSHAWDEANHHSESFPSPQVGIILGTGSYYTPPRIGPDHFYISKGDGVNGVQWPTKYPSDEVISGMPLGQHFTASYTWQLMVGA